MAVIDTGIQADHPDLIDRIWTNPGEIPGNNIDDDNNGYIDDVNGWDFFDDDNFPNDGSRHGTHVAGTIAATGDNNEGVIGVAPDISLMPLKFLGPSGSGSLSDGFEALAYVTMMRRAGHPVVGSNNSWGGGPYNADVEALIDEATLPGW